MKRLFVFLCAMVLVFGVVGVANSALIDRGGGLIYDSDQDITWLQDANYAQSSGYDADGLMNWDDSMFWADGLEYYDSIRNVIWDDWRLSSALNPDGSGPDYGFTSGSEMGHLYYVELNNISGDGGFINSGPFVSIIPGHYHLLEKNYTFPTQVTNPTNVWNFAFEKGKMSLVEFARPAAAWAVMDGDVGAVPIPSAIWLLGSGLIGIVGFRKKLKLA